MMTAIRTLPLASRRARPATAAAAVSIRRWSAAAYPGAAHSLATAARAPLDACVRKGASAVRRHRDGQRSRGTKGTLIDGHERATVHASAAMHAPLAAGAPSLHADQLPQLTHRDGPAVRHAVAVRLLLARVQRLHRHVGRERARPLVLTEGQDLGHLRLSRRGVPAQPSPRR